MKRYIIGLNVNDSSELPEAAENIRKFSETIGTPSEMEIQVSINPLLTQSVQTDAIGFAYEAEDGEYDEDEDDE